MPINSPSEIVYNFDRSYDELPPMNVPVRVVEPRADHVYWGGVSAIPAFSNELYKLKIHPDFSVTDPQGIAATTIVLTLVVVVSATNFYIGLQQPIIIVNDVISDSIFLTFDTSSDDVVVDGVDVDGGKLTTQSTFQNPIRVTRFNSYQTYSTLSATGYSINLTVSGNRSELVSPSGYYTDTEAHLKRYAAFVQMQQDGQGLVTDRIKTSSDKIYGRLNVVGDFETTPAYFIDPIKRSDNIFIGTSGVGTFYYYED